ncbi:Carbohydrate binding family 6 [Catenulispora acidiphila DSM 44928]|uniref:Carbohydrate binding family 6 n=1 Tax=Catenulispora acidiphila (strain DSM 44928 / JCM 14897 / NBRC 102108 / NRRL B-24433 / ID139908) TaxID=479433 RepID=C7PZB4_CATAD|nr:carbohydrate-binding protein [Catenulispora acidiphila]ACU71571.1 Carbohydrate binding family 6 [Catenulispora acidiphila DSM 44928]
MPGFNRRAFIKTVGAGTAAVAVPVSSAPSRAGAASSASAAPAVLGETVTASGSWQVTASALGWTFSGAVGSSATGITTGSGTDPLGAYTETTFTFQSGARKGGIRVYNDASAVIFTDTYVKAAANSKPFPTFTGYPGLAHHLSHRDCFGKVQFNTFSGASDSPWVFFDAAGNTFVLSAANHFQEAQTTQGTDGSIAAGVLTSIATLPAGYTRQTILTAKAGVGAAYHAWGSALTTLAGKILPPNDSGAILSTLGYWTDNGADYYYKYDTSKGYTGTLLAVRDEWQSKQIPMGYMQLDSWWYPKGPTDTWNHVTEGTYLYQADAELFPDGLAAFHQQLGKPLVTHGRWMDSSSPYHGEYQFSNDVVIDPKFWQSVMDYLRAGGVAVYEQDWLCNNAKPAENLTDADAFFDNMAHSAAADGLDLQYCMALPRDYLQSTRYPNLTTIRVSDDRFDTSKWDVFLYDSQFAGALGIWPWVDVFMSGETNNLLLANLSAGPVGVGDALGKVNSANLFKVVRPDGVIVKPDVPIVPTDATYVGEAAGNLPAMVAATSVGHVGLKYGYVFAYARQTTPPQQTYQAENATLSGPVVATDNAGYTGTGYADYQNASNDYVQWTVQAATAGMYTLQFRYANGGTTNRPLAVTANGGSHTLPFAPTGSWTTWGVQALTVTLAKGSNTVRATATGSNGGNIDWLGVSQGTVPTGPSQTASFSLAALGLTGPAYAYDYFAGTGVAIAQGGSLTATVSTGTYWIVAPVGASGIAFLGDAGKFVAHGDKRIPHLSDDGQVHATLAFAPGEAPVTLHGHAPRQPTVTATTGSVGAVGYSAATGIFTVTVTAAAATGEAVITITP